jgi:hypothetical protein
MTTPVPASTPWVPMWSLQGGVAIGYVGGWVPGTYQAGQIVVDNGIEYMCVRQTNKRPTPWAASQAASYGTTLPANPIDGQEAILVDNIAGATWAWRFRFNANSGSQFKWEFIGGSPIQPAPSGSMTLVTTQTTAIDFTGGPVISVPRAGDYRYIWGANVYNAGTFAGAYATILQVFNGATALSASYELRHHGSVYDGASISGSGAATLAATTINIKAWLDRTGSNTTMVNGWIHLFPVRVA